MMIMITRRTQLSHRIKAGQSESPEMEGNTQLLIKYLLFANNASKEYFENM